ncbi:MAG: hypothetical protein ACOYXB_07325 [Bacteroidota bacterium]
MTWKIFSVAILFVLSGCERQSLIGEGDTADFYILEEFRTQENSMAILEGTALAGSEKIIGYNDILSYSPLTCTFIVSDSISERLNDVSSTSVHGTPFALVIGGEIIYTGYFWAGFSSRTVDWITIDPLDYTGDNSLPVTLGYPAGFAADEIPDKRNDPRLLSLLKRDDKLVD